jgi:hypothetical protein
MTAPDVEWQGAETVKLSHRKILHRAGEILRRLSPEKAQQWREDLTAARAYREVFSYRFPAAGPGLLRENAIDPRPVAELGRLLVELAMLNSECFDGVLRDHAPTDISIQSVTDHDWASAYEIAGEKVIDPDDQYRFGKFLCGWKRVSTLEVMASDGLIEDFYGGWCAADPGEGDFDPDEWVDHLLWL